MTLRRKYSMYIRFGKRSTSGIADYTFDRMNRVNSMPPERAGDEAVAAFEMEVENRTEDTTRILLLQDEVVIREWPSEA